ncbi:MAG TPA: hypothetical protein P5307_27490, partial [Pirellulaceae bacterium]|nr:hypothetical protein [Pirellulaceae bacterium]
DKQAKRLRKTIASDTARESRPTSPLFVVATQCIEVGADLDFDAIVSEAAPLDALRQRFGRLNRTARPINARGIVVIQEENRRTDEQLETLESSGKQDDPVYGNALARAWNAIWRASEGDDSVRHLDFGIAAMEVFLPRLGNDDAKKKLGTTNRDAPILLPSHLDLLCQTSPAPWPDPDVSLWLHGLQRSNPDVLVCWRADLPAIEFEESKKSVAWTQAVSLCPPSSIECMPVPIGKVKGWLAQHKLNQDDDADIPAATVEALDAKVSTIPEECQPLLWRGVEKSTIAENVNDIHPGDTLVLPVAAGGWNELGFIPRADDDASRISTGAITTEQSAAIVDVAEEAYFTSRRRRIVRLYPARLRALPNSEVGEALIEFCSDQSSPLSIREIRELIQDWCDETDDPGMRSLVRNVITGKFSVDRYFGPGGTVAQEGIVLTSCTRELGDATVADDDGADGL